MAEFDSAVAAARSAVVVAHGDLDVVVARLRAVLGSWRGRPLGDVGEASTVSAEAARLELAHWDGVELLAAFDLSAGRHGEAIAAMELLVVESALQQAHGAERTGTVPHFVRRNSIASVTAIGLGAIGALHVAWGRGSTFPFRHRSDLNDHVVGRQVSPSPAACNTVAGLLAAAAVAVASAASGSSMAARVASAGCGAVLGARAVLGFTGRTHLAVPGSTSANFVRNDRRIFSPICAALSIGAFAAAATRTRCLAGAIVERLELDLGRTPPAPPTA